MPEREVNTNGDELAMSTIDESTVRHIAHLARLRLNEGEVRQMTAELAAIVEYVRTLNEVNTEEVPPTAHPMPLTNVFREDEPRACIDVEQALQNAPLRHGEFFRVPKVLNQETA